MLVILTAKIIPESGIKKRSKSYNRKARACERSPYYFTRGLCHKKMNCKHLYSYWLLSNTNAFPTYEIAQ